MKGVLILASMAFFAACTSNESGKTSSTSSAADTTAANITSPYEIQYSSKFIMDDPKNAESLLKLWKVWDEGNLSAGKDLFADSMELHLSDGSVMKGPTDSVLASAQAFRNTFASSVSTVNAIMAVKSTDKNQNWALIWGKEVDTDKKGNKDSSYLQETWRFNKDGKTDLMYQFRQAGAPPKK
jgi:hypothetical protein